MMRSADTPEHLDVLVVGAGLSGIGAGVRLQQLCPDKSYAILEARETIGGTWDHFRYPGLRSDSDMYSFAYAFRPWSRPNAIGQGWQIRDYIRETAAEYGVEERVRFGHQVLAAAWSSAESRWTVEVERDGKRTVLSCGFLYWCSGYFRYDAGYTPELPGRERFAGPIVHPQAWDEQLDYAGKRVVVIGSGATAVTLVPELAKTAAHVTMLQRSPSYYLAYPTVDPLAAPLLRALPHRLAHAILRWKNVAITAGSYEVSRRWPKAARRLFLAHVRALLPEGYDVETHFTPRYAPWDQRVCLVPNRSLFRAIRQGRVEMATDTIETFTEQGVLLSSGRELPADMVVTATGLALEALGGASLEVDGRPVVLADHVGYRALMLDGVPNMAQAIGYTNASFTLKCDLTHQYVCRLLNHMDAGGYTRCVARTPAASMQRLPFVDFSSGFVQRSIHEFQRQGAEAPWRLSQNYPRDIRTLLHEELEDGVMEFSRA